MTGWEIVLTLYENDLFFRVSRGKVHSDHENVLELALDSFHYQLFLYQKLKGQPCPQGRDSLGYPYEDRKQMLLSSFSNGSVEVCQERFKVLFRMIILNV